jgi:hypothetical protein
MAVALAALNAIGPANGERAVLALALLIDFSKAVSN